MPRFDLQLTFLSDAESKGIASRQLLSFLRVPTEAGPGTFAPSKENFLISAIPEGAVTTGPSLFSFQSTELFDVDDNLVFRDQVLDLGDDKEIRVRTAAADLLRSPVWSVASGRKLDTQAMIAKTVKSLPGAAVGPLKPVPTSSGAIRLIVYSYPRLGIRAALIADPQRQFIVDIGDQQVVPVDAFKNHDDPESVISVSSPYDTVVATTIGKFRSLWRLNTALLPSLPEAGADLQKAVEAARTGVLEEKTVNPELVLSGQQTQVFCAVATAQMVLKHHGIDKSQDDIATAMHTGASGTTNDNQIAGYQTLSQARLLASLDETASFEKGKGEILENRPFKSGITGHARACGGYKLDEGGKTWLYIYDPWPPNQGAVYYEDWGATYHTNYIYVKPTLFP